MKRVDVDKMCELVRHGAKLYISHDAAGRQKVKIVHGPFGLIVKRFAADDAQVEKLKSQVEVHY